MLNYLSNQLHNLSQVLFFLQDLLSFSTERHKLRKVLIIIFIQSTSVFAVAYEPVDRGEVLPLSQLLIKTPENLREEDDRRILSK